MRYLTCTMISSVDLAHYGVSRAKDWVSVDCGTKHYRLSMKHFQGAQTKLTSQTD